MNAWKGISLFAAAAVLALAAATPGAAQVDKVALRTHGLSCGDCSVVSEVYLRRLESVADVAIRTAQEFILLTLKPGSSFDPWELRDTLERTEVDVLQLQISARGRAHEEGGKQIFVAGKNKFVLVGSQVKVPSDTDVAIEGSVNDQPDPMELKALSFKPAK